MGQSAKYQEPSNNVQHARVERFLEISTICVSERLQGSCPQSLYVPADPETVNKFPATLFEFDRLPQDVAKGLLIPPRAAIPSLVQCVTDGNGHSHRDNQEDWQLSLLKIQYGFGHSR